MPKGRKEPRRVTWLFRPPPEALDGVTALYREHALGLIRLAVVILATGRPPRTLCRTRSPGSTGGGARSATPVRRWATSGPACWTGQGPCCGNALGSRPRMVTRRPPRPIGGVPRGARGHPPTAGPAAGSAGAPLLPRTRRGRYRPVDGGRWTCRTTSTRTSPAPG